MCEITVRNFKDKYPTIIQDVQRCSFIALDCEFTGLGAHDGKISLFDEPEDRYDRMRATISDVLVTQLGLTLFEYDKGHTYRSATYVFYLFPRSYPYSPENFVCDSRSMQFLAHENYDFNKTFKMGLTYVRASQERQIAREVKNGRMVQRLKKELTVEDRRKMEEICSDVYDWLYHYRTMGHTIVDLTDFDPVRRYLIRLHIESQFRVRTSYIEGFKLKVERGERSDLEKRNELMEIVMGVTSLVKEIVAMRKPIIGHNMFLDLLMFYKTFFAPLPPTYSQFKQEISIILPVVYDTKLLAFEMKKRVGKVVLDTALNLKRLFDYFTVDKGRDMVPEMPVVLMKPYCSISSTAVHDSGYDSFTTGYVYLQLAHMFSMWDEKKGVMTYFPVGSDPLCYFRVTEPFRNRVNMMRGKIGHFNLAGPDPANQRPNLLLVETKSGRDLDPSELTKIIAKFDTADLRVLTSNQILIATSSVYKLRVIEVAISNVGQYKVSWYNPTVKRKKQTSMYKGMAALAMAGILCLLVCKKFK